MRRPRLKQITAVMLLTVPLSASTCPRSAPGLPGFQPFPVPSSAFHVGQVVAVYTRPNKVSIITDPNFPQDSARTVAVNQGSISTSKAAIEAGYKNAVQGTLGGVRIRDVTVDYSNTRSLQTRQDQIVAALVEKLKGDALARAYVRDLQRQGVVMNVIETIFVADLSITFKDSTGATVAVTGPTLSELKNKIGGEYTLNENGTVLGKTLAIGFQTSPDILRFVLTQVPD